MRRSLPESGEAEGANDAPPPLSHCLPRLGPGIGRQIPTMATLRDRGLRGQYRMAQRTFPAAVFGEAADNRIAAILASGTLDVSRARFTAASGRRRRVRLRRTSRDARYRAAAIAADARISGGALSRVPLSYRPRAASWPLPWWADWADGFATRDPRRWPIDGVGIGNREQALSRLATTISLQEKPVALQGGRVDLTEVLGHETSGCSSSCQAGRQCRPSRRRRSVPTLLLAQAQIEIQRERARAGIAFRWEKLAGGYRSRRFHARKSAEIGRRRAARGLPR